MILRKRENDTEWHRVFVVWPRKTLDDAWVFLEWVEKKGAWEGWQGHNDTLTVFRYQYRLPQ